MSPVYAAHDADTVWGVGATPEAALLDAQQGSDYEKEGGEIAALDTDRISEPRATKIRNGNTDWADRFAYVDEDRDNGPLWAAT